MDYARKIGKTDEAESWRRRIVSSVSVSDGMFESDQIFSEDPPLVNWKGWLARRRKQYEHIESSTGRHRTDQIINTCETIRPLIEMRELMDYANILEPVLSTNLRTVPKFWRAPKTLPNHDNPCLPIVAVAASKKESDKPELMYVDLPELIEKEKDLVGLKTKQPLWKQSQYLKSRKCQLSKEIQSLVPHEPKTKHLTIEGHGFAKPKAKEYRRLPVITLSDALLEKDEGEVACHPEELRDQTIALRIEDRDIVWEKCAFELGRTDPIVWNVCFSSQMNKMVEKEIRLENKGNRVIIYEWRNAVSLPSMLPLRRRASPFFFNKTKGVIPPGQIVDIKFWYLPRISGMTSEVWRFKTDPELCPSPFHFRLSGCSDTAIADRSGAVKSSDDADVDDYLDHCIREAAIREILEEMFENMDYVELPEPFYGSLFLESEVFLAKNPLCFYHPSHVIEFRKLYHTATNHNEQQWNLCIRDLRETLTSIRDPETRQDMLLQLSRLYKECLKPARRVPHNYTKHEMVSNLLCAFFNRFEHESAHAKLACFKKERRESIVTVSEMGNGKSTTSQRTVISNNSRNRRGRRSSSRTQNAHVPEVARKNSYFIPDDRAYKEIFFIRIHYLLGKMVDQVVAAVNSFNNLNEPDK
nr:MYCBP-associated protein-like [Megalopta genalis]